MCVVWPLIRSDDQVFSATIDLPIQNVGTRTVDNIGKHIQRKEVFKTLSPGKPAILLGPQTAK